MLQLIKPTSSKTLLQYQDKTGNILEKEIEKIAKNYSAYVIAFLEPLYAYREELELDTFFNLRLLPRIQEISSFTTQNKDLHSMFKEPNKEFILL